MAQIERATGRQGSRRWFWYCKRFLDVVLCSLALAVIWPLLLLIMLVIWLDDRGASPIYTQMRVGRGGKLFKLYKFRSMVTDADKMLDQLMDKNEMDGPVFKIANDPRITRVGRFIRKTSLDELPQLINILKGDMTIVGPRPPLPREVEQYDEYTYQRLWVTPGLTCFWQIAPARNKLSFHEWVDMDIHYVKNRRLMVDLKIILLTVVVVLTAQGA